MLSTWQIIQNMTSRRSYVRPVAQVAALLFTMLCAQAAVAQSEGEAVRLTGDTSEAELSTFVLGEPVRLSFSAAGLNPGQELRLDLRFLDEHDEVIKHQNLDVTGNAEGNWSGTVAGVSDRLGFYRVEAELSNGVKLAGLGTRPAGFLTYAVVPDPAQRRDFGETRSRFGMQGGFGRAWGNRSLALLGARWVLDGNFEWRRNEPDRAGQFAEALTAEPQKWDPPSPADWNTYALPTLFAAPKWAVVPETFSYMTGTLTPEHESAWQEYCRHAVQAFMRKYPDRSERIYQITWEPMPPWGFKGNLRDLVRVYELAYPVIHETDPSAVVAGPTLGLHHREDIRATRDVFALGLAEHLDAYSSHPYFSLTPERDGMIERIRTLKAILRNASDKPLPMLGTEQGQSTKEKRDAELKHARGLIRQNLITLGEGFRFNMAFYIVDYHLAGQTGYGYYYNLVDGVPWGPAKAGPRPIVPAYAAQSLLLDGSDPVRAIDWLGDTAWGYAFERDGDVTLALWDYGDEPRSVRLPVGVERVEVIDWMGRAAATPADEAQSIELTLGPEPVYVTGVSARLWGKAGVSTLATAEDPTVGTPAEEVAIDLSLAAPADAGIDGEIRIAADPQLGLDEQRLPVSLGPGAKQTEPLRLTLPADAPPGDYTLRLALVQDDRPVALAGHRVKIVAPVAIERVTPTIGDDGTPGVRVTLHDRRGQGQTGQLGVDVASLLRLPAMQDFELDAGQTREVTVAVRGGAPHPLTLYPVSITTTTAAGQQFMERRHVNWFAPPRIATPPQIDARLDDWSPIQPIALPHRPGEPSDFDANVRAAWDDEALYLAIDVTDDVFFQRWDSHNTWRGDSVSVTVNLDPQASDVASGNELADAAKRPRASRFAVALTPGGVEAYRHTTPNADALPTGPVSAEAVSAAVEERPGGMTYEIAVRWSALGAEAPPTPGQPVGLSLAVADRDADEPEPHAMNQLFRGLREARGAGEGAGESGLLLLGTVDSPSP